MMIKFSQFFFTFMKGTFTFDISLKAGNKTIGSLINNNLILINFINDVFRYQDDFPLFTGFLFGLHKMQVFLLGSVMIMGLMKAEKKNLDLKFGKILFIY